MTGATLTWSAPGWLVPAAAAAVAALALLSWGYGRASGGGSLRLAAGLLKAIGLVALIACLLEPMITGTRPRPGANQFVVLIDDSRSLRIRDAGAVATRAETVRALAAETAGWHARLAQAFDVRRYRFAERLQTLATDDALDASGDASNLATALRTIAGRYRGRPLAGILVLTDGNATDLSDGAIDASGLPPIYAVPIGAAAAQKDIRLEEIAVSQTNFEETPVVIRATVAGDGWTGEAILVDLLDESGERVERQEVAFEDGQTSRALRFQVRPERAGVSFHRLRAVSKSEGEAVFGAPETSAEATLANNERLVAVDRPGGPFRVLYVSGRPNWEFKFLRRALAEDREVDLVGLIRIAKREPKFVFLGRDASSANPLFKGFAGGEDEETEQYDQPVIIRVGTRDAEELRGGFPKTEDALYAYHAVILDDLEAGFFTQEAMLLLRTFVSDRGGGFCMLGGAESFRQGDYERTPIADLLPVYLDRPAEEPPAGGFRLDLTREGWLDPWLRLRATEDAERARLDAMPAFLTLNRADKIKPGATVLAHVKAVQGGASHPALVAQRFGRGRAAAVLAGDLWRWTLRREAGEEDDLARAWRQMVRWLVAEVPRRVEFVPERKAADPRRALALRVEARDEEYRPLDNARSVVAIAGPDGRTHECVAEPQADQPGVYVASFVSDRAGPYRAKATVTAPDGSPAGERETGWTAEPAADEFRRLAPDRAMLERIARESGGDIVEPDDLAGFVADLPNRKIPIVESWAYPFWHQPLVLLFAIACLIAEWGLRRWRGLP
ncbi:MAG: hypothetical protein JXP34_11600 [Planctomycetes bacterium]|nr:hypothetical protein [Planctomycetota bacterium]